MRDAWASSGSVAAGLPSFAPSGAASRWGGSDRDRSAGATVGPTFFPGLRPSSRNKKVAPSGPPLRCGVSLRSPCAPSGLGLPIAIEAAAGVARSKGETDMAAIGTFIAQGDGYTGSIKTLTLNVKPPKRLSMKISRSGCGSFRMSCFRRTVSVWDAASAEGGVVAAWRRCL